MWLFMMKKFPLNVTLRRAVFFFLAFSDAASSQYQPLSDDRNRNFTDLVFDIEQDALGFLWVAGKRGVSRFDGYQYQRVIDGFTLDIAIADDVLWAANKAGVFRYELTSNQLQRYRVPGLEGRDLLITQVRIKQDQLLIGTSEGAYVLQLDKPTDVARSIGRAKYVRYVLTDKQGRIWIGYSSGGLSVLDSGFNEIFTTTECGDRINVLYEYLGNVYAGTQGRGLCTISQTSFSVTSSLGDIIVRSITADENTGDLWVATDGDGIFRVSPTGRIANTTVQNDEFSLISNQVYALFRTLRGDIIISFFPAGLQLFDRSMTSFRRYRKDTRPQALPDNAVTYLHETANRIWIGTENGLAFIDKPSEVITQIPMPRDSQYGGRYPVTAILDFGGDIWVGTWGQGLLRYNERENSWKRYIEGDGSGLQDKFIWTLEKDGRNALWVGTENAGIAQYQTDNEQFVHYSPPDADQGPLSYSFVYDLLVDPPNRLWVGTRKGLLSFDVEAKTFTRPFQLETGKAGHQVVSLYRDRSQRLWIGTENNGVFYGVPGSTFSSLTEREGLPSNHISAIREDASGDVWVATLSGLVRVDPNTQTLRILDKQSGLSGSYFNRHALVASGNTIYVGLSQGLNVFDIQPSTGEETFVPRLQITRMTINYKTIEDTNGQSIAYLDTLALDRGVDNFGFDFSVLTYRPSDVYRYYYRLLGLRDEWVASDRNTAMFTSLSPGTYQFQVYARSINGIETGKRTVTITVRPPIHRSSLAYSLYAIAIIMLAVWGQVYLRRQKQYELKRQYLLNDRLKALNNMKDEFLAKTAHELRTPIAGIVSTVKVIYDRVDVSLRDPLDLIISEGNRLNFLINDILDHSKMQDHSLTLHCTTASLYRLVADTFGILRHLASEKDIELINDASPDLFLYADANRLQQVLINLVSNGIKYSHGGYVRCYTEMNDRFLLAIEDTGVGIPSDKLDLVFRSYHRIENSTGAQGTGLGMVVTKSLVELHGGTIELLSTENEGTHVRLIFPLNIVRPRPENAIHSPAHSLKQHSKIMDCVRVAVVDDDPVNRMCLVAYLHKAGILCTEFKSAENLLDEVMVSCDYDVVLSDVNMPTMNGVELKKQLQARDGPPIVFMTAATASPELAVALQIDEDFILSKPVNYERLLEVIGRVVSNR